jgi:hypothetical protein
MPRITEDQIKELVTGLVKDQVFTWQHLPADDPHLLPMVFMVLGLGGLGDIDPDSIGTVYEYLDKAGPQGINGYPIFLSCKLVHKDDWKTVLERAIKVEKAIEKAMTGAVVGDEEIEGE